MSSRCYERARSDKAHAFLAFAYGHLAEHLAETEGDKVQADAEV